MLRALLDDPRWLVALALGFLLVVQTLRLWIARRRAGFRSRRRNRIAAQAERGAERLLARAGYRVVEVQPRLGWSIEVDGRPEPVQLRADLLVTRRGRRYVADVKSGRIAPDLHTAATRRQLLEYLVAYRTDGVLLVDMEAGEIREVRFPLPRP